MQQTDTEARREYYKRWRERNREKIREYNARYWHKRAERAAAESEVKRNDDNSESCK